MTQRFIDDLNKKLFLADLFFSCNLEPIKINCVFVLSTSVQIFISFCNHSSCKFTCFVQTWFIAIHYILGLAPAHLSDFALRLHQFLVAQHRDPLHYITLHYITLRYRGGNSTSSEEVSRFQCFLIRTDWCGRVSHHKTFSNTQLMGG